MALSSAPSVSPPEASPDIGKRSVLFAFLIIAALFALHAWAEYKGAAALEWSVDARIYGEMAEDPFTFTQAPNGYRVLIPLLVHYLPPPTGLGFLLVNGVLMYLTLIFLYKYLRALGMRRVRAIQGIGVCVLSYGVWYTFYNYVLVEGLTFFAIAGAFLTIQTRRYVWFWLFMVLGVLNKEVAFFILPVYFLNVFGADDRLVARRYGAFVRRLILAFAVAALVSLLMKEVISRGVVALLGEDFVFRNHIRGWVVKYVLTEHILRPIFVKNLLALFTFFWAFMAANLFLSRKNRDFAFFYSPYVILTSLLIFVATDTARMLFYLFPILVPLAVNGFAPLDAWRAVSAPLKALIVALLAFLALPGLQKSLLLGETGGLGLIVIVAAGAFVVGFGLRSTRARGAARESAIELL